MRTALLTREESDDEGTFGTFSTDSGFSCKSGELPWRDNQVDVSCVPCGVYECVWLRSPKFGFCYHVQDVTGRQNVEIHPANFMGDTSKGFRSDLLGCVALGLQVSKITKAQKGLVFSKAAIAGMNNDLKGESFTLTITENFSVVK